MDWQPIASAPRDGTVVYARRVYDGKLIAEGFAKWGVNSPTAPMRQWSSGGLYPDIPPNNEYADTARWVTHDGRFSFPEPTHWKHGR